MASNKSNEDALVHALEFKAAKAASVYMGEDMSSRWIQKTPLIQYTYIKDKGYSKDRIQEKTD